MSEQLDLVTDAGVQDVSIVDRMEQSFLEYSMSVIVGRALPDARDGLKPVQRRILYSMWESGLRPNRPHRKCASAVGEVMKHYHPHGDSSIYDALVRMAQDFSTREPLVDGHGNFGSVDGDPPAAMRYTEARLSILAMELLAGIDEETVDFKPNYDGYETEPTVLPSRFPNLLVNGASGIAVGMATNIAPHNLGEVINACLHMITKPDATVAHLMKMVPAPDFPTGARIIDGDGIRDAYLTGKGAVTIEAVASTEMRSGNLPRIIVSEIPYQVNKTTLLLRIADLIQKSRINGIRDLRDESSRDGMRIVIELKRGEAPAATLEKLYKLTDLRTNFNVNCVALVDGAPKTLGLVELIEVYLAHQRMVLTRRTEHRLRVAEARAHILEGLLKALDHLDEVIKLIRASASASDAREGLMSRFDMSEIQATAVLDMQLRKLAALERAALEDEFQELQDRIAGLRAILDDPARLDAVLVEELTEIKRVHATPRRSAIVSEGITAEDVLVGGSTAGFVAQEVTVMVTRKGYLKSLSRRRTTPAHKHVSDPLVAVIRTDTDGKLLLIDADGGGWIIAVGDIPVVKANARGTLVAQLLGDAPTVGFAGAVPLPVGEAFDDVTVVTVSAGGQVKRTAVAEFDTPQRSLKASGVKSGDRIVGAALCTDDDDLVLAHSGGYVTRFAAGEVRSMGRSAAGVGGMKVAKGAEIVSMTVLEGGADEGHLTIIAADGEAKRAPLSDVGRKGRGGKGLMTGTDRLVFAGVAEDLHVHGEPPVLLRPVEVVETKRTGSGERLPTPVSGPAVVEQISPVTEEG